MEVINRAFMPILPTKTYAISETNKYSFDLYTLGVYNPILYMFEISLSSLEFYLRINCNVQRTTLVTMIIFFKSYTLVAD